METHVFGPQPGALKENLHIIFSSCGVIFALNYSHVCEIIPCMDTALINGAPEYVRGLINYGGEICPVVSLCYVTEMSAESASPGKYTANISAKSCIIMIKTAESGGAAIGILADSFLGSYSFTEKDVRPADSSLNCCNLGPVKGYVDCPQGAAGVLNLGEFFKWMDWLEL